MKPSIHVVAGIIYREDGRFLIARKKTGKPLAGLWEFPGGKIEEGEDPMVALSRELKEELGITVEDILFLTTTSFSYPEATVTLHCYACNKSTEEIALTDHDAIEWITISEALLFEFAPADIPVLGFLEASINR